MKFHRGAITRLLPLIALAFAALSVSAQSGNAGIVRGTVTDPCGAVIPNATVHLTNAGQRIRPHHNHRRHRPVHLLQRPVQPLPDQRLRQGFCLT